MNKSSEIYKSRINKAIDYVNNNLSKPISLDELAAVAFFSPFHFHRIFVAITGETVNNFTNRIRSEKAARLLRFSERPISEIAFNCGFSSTSTLSRLFKQYFEISPSDYRKGIEIKNSKIRKALYPVSTYHCSINKEQLKNKFPVVVKQFEERRIAYIRTFDAFKEGVVLSAFERLVKWAKEVGLFHSETIFGMSIDDPEVTPKEKYRYEACITVPRNFKIEPSNLIETTTLPRCKYAVTKVCGDLNLVAEATNYLFDHWLINSSYECAHQPGLEIFVDKENVCNWTQFNLELCIPVKELTEY